MLDNFVKFCLLFSKTSFVATTIVSNSLNPDQARQNDGSYLGSKCLRDHWELSVNKVSIAAV